MSEDKNPTSPTPNTPNEGGEEWINLHGFDIDSHLENLSRKALINVIKAYRAENMTTADEDFLAFIMKQQNSDGHGSFDEFFTFNNCMTCICADCGKPAPEIRLTTAQGESIPMANCPTCNEITGVEFESSQIMSIHNGEGSEVCHQMFLRHFPDSYTPTLEEWVEVLREEEEECECITTDMGGYCLHCGKAPRCSNCGAESTDECPAWCLFEMGVIPEIDPKLSKCDHINYADTLNGVECLDCGEVHEVVECEDCEGTGYAQTERAPCSTCGGSGTNEVSGSPTGEVVE